MRIAKVQAISGLAFVVFLLLHLATTSSAVGGPEAYDGVLGTLRSIYRPHLVVEILLVGLPAGVHIACAVIQIVRRIRTRSRSRPALRVRIHRWAGYVLLAAIGGHVFATRVMPALASGATATGKADFAYLAYSVLGWPLFIDPYYVLLGIAGAVHLFLGLGLALRIVAPRRFDAARLRRASIAGAIAVALLVTAGVGSIIARSSDADRTRFPEYEALYDEWMPFMPHPASKPRLPVPRCGRERGRSRPSRARRSGQTARIQSWAGLPEVRTPNGRRLVNRNQMGG